MKWTRRKATTLLFVVVAIIAAFLWRMFSPREPVYQGKPLSAWLGQYNTGYAWRGPNDPSVQEAERAIRNIGAEALPFLIRYMRTSDSSLKKRMRAIAPGSWHDRLGLRDKSAELRRLGGYCLRALGTNAAPAAPAMIEMAVQHPDEDGRLMAVYGLGSLAPVAGQVIPIVSQYLTNADYKIREAAAAGLAGRLDGPEIVVPLLIQHLQFCRDLQYSFECRNTVDRLGFFGTNAKAATPILLELIHHFSAGVRSEATNLLLLIDAEAAAKAGVKRPAPSP